VRLLDHLFHFDEIRVHSRRPESREAFGARLERDLGRPIRVVDDWESCVRGADIVVEASRLPKPEPILKTAWIAKGAFVVPYGTMSALELSLTEIMDKMVVDDWGQCRKGLPFGALREHVDSGRLHEGNLHAELGQIVAGLRPGRERDDETILLWHRGLSITDIALGHALLEKAKRTGVGPIAALQLITSFRMYNAGPEAAAAWRALFGGSSRSSRFRSRSSSTSGRRRSTSCGKSPSSVRVHVRMALFARRRHAGDRGARAVATALCGPAALLQRVPRARGKRVGATRRRFRASLRLDGRGFAIGIQRAARASRAFRELGTPHSFLRIDRALGNPAKALEALATRRVDLVALDGFYLDLVRRYQPEKLAGVRTIATTEWTPIPLVVASPRRPPRSSTACARTSCISTSTRSTVPSSMRCSSNALRPWMLACIPCSRISQAAPPRRVTPTSAELIRAPAELARARGLLLAWLLVASLSRWSPSLSSFRWRSWAASSYSCSPSGESAGSSRKSRAASTVKSRSKTSAYAPRGRPRCIRAHPDRQYGLGAEPEPHRREQPWSAQLEFSPAPAQARRGFVDARAKAEMGLELNGERATWRFCETTKGDPSRIELHRVALEDGHVIYRNETRTRPSSAGEGSASAKRPHGSAGQGASFAARPRSSKRACRGSRRARRARCVSTRRATSGAWSSRPMGRPPARRSTRSTST
jgi:hypothetical protein